MEPAHVWLQYISGISVGFYKSSKNYSFRSAMNKVIDYQINTLPLESVPVGPKA
jgi:hypothetical protein